MNNLTDMWQALEKHQPIADQLGYGQEWKHMCVEHTVDACRTAADAARAARDAAADAASSAVDAAIAARDADADADAYDAAIAARDADARDAHAAYKAALSAVKKLNQGD